MNRQPHNRSVRRIPNKKSTVVSISAAKPVDSVIVFISSPKRDILDSMANTIESATEYHRAQCCGSHMNKCISNVRLIGLVNNAMRDRIWKVSWAKWFANK